MQGFVKYVKHHLLQSYIVKRVQYLTAILACTIVNQPSIIHCSRDALIFIPTFMYNHILHVNQILHTLHS